MMTDVARCARCGAPLSSIGPEGLCLGCLLREGFGEASPEGESGIADRVSHITSFGDYELLAEIARGGMGVVYRARQKSLGRLVALKMVLAGRLATPREVERFRTEAQTAAQLRHPNIIAIHEVGEHEGRPFFTMDYVPGRTLAEIVRDEPLPARRAATYLKVVAEAVHTAHQQGIVHRDLKPSNVIIDDFDQPRITDFGLAKRLTGDSDLTLSAQVLGSPNYLPPEQAGGGPDHDWSLSRSTSKASWLEVIPNASDRESCCPPGRRAVQDAERDRSPVAAPTMGPGVKISTTAPGDDNGAAGRDLSAGQAGAGRSGTAGSWKRVGPWSDVYSLGAILYHLLTGRPPFQADSLTTLLRQVIETEPVAPRVLNPNIPRDLETICLKCLEKEASRRYPTAQALAEELGRFLEDKPIQARPISPAGKAWRWCRRQPVRAGLIAALILVFLLGFGGVLWQWRQTEFQRRIAVEAKLRMQRLVYNADMALAWQAFAGGDIRRVREHLDRYRPEASDQWSVISDQQRQLDLANTHPARSPLAPHPSPLTTDLRDWEWRFLWAQCQPQATFKLGKFQKPVSCLAFTADSQRLFVGQTWGGTNSLWDISNRRMILASPYQTFGQAVAFCTARDWLVESLDVPKSKEGELFVRDVVTGKTVFSLGDNLVVNGVAISPDGRRLAAQCGSMLQLWDLEQQRMINNQLCPNRDDLGPMVFSSHCDRLAVGHNDGTIRLLDAHTGLEQTNFHVYAGSGSVLSLAFSPDDRLLASGEGLNATNTQYDLAVWLTDLQTGQHVKLATNRRPADVMTFDATGRHLAWSCEWGVRIWDMSARRSRGILRQSVVSSLAFSPDGRYLAAGEGTRENESSSVCFYDLNQVQPKPESPYRVLTNWIPSLAFEGRGQTFLAAMGPVVRYDTATLERREEIAALGTNNAFLALSRDGRLLATAQSGNVVRAFTTGDWREVKTLTNQECIAPRFLGPGRLLRTYTRGFLQLWDTTTWQPKEFWPSTTQAISERIMEVDLSRDGAVLATGHMDGTVRLWNVETGQMETRFAGHKGYVNIGALAFSPDGLWLVSASSDGSTLLWDVGARSRHASLEGYAPFVVQVAFSPDSRRLVCRGLLGAFAVELWDPILGQAVGTLAGEHNGTYLTTFSPDGNTLVDIDASGLAHFWHAPSLTEIEAREKAKMGNGKQ